MNFRVFREGVDGSKVVIERDERTAGETTQFLAESVAQLSEKPKTFLCASGISYYGETKDSVLDEDGPKGDLAGNLVPPSCGSNF